MTYGAFTQDFASYELVQRPRKPVPQAALCAVALTLSTTVGLWALYARPFVAPAEPAPQIILPQTVPAPSRAKATVANAKIAVPLRRAQGAAPPAPAAAKIDVALLYPSLTSGYTAGTFALDAPSGASFAPPAPVAPALPVIPAPAPAAAAPALPVPPAPQAAAPHTTDVPLPLPRPASLLATHDKPAAGARTIAQARPERSQPAGAPAAEPSFFEKMFGSSRPAGTALAYAAPDDGGLFGGGRRPAGGYDRYTAVYDITAHTVTLPDGTRLEAHSGLGPYKDNPASVAMRMVGVTPPNLYELTFREAAFHGVRALRLTPTGGTTYGRAGLLAHTYMLRGRVGESNGCVVFRDYERFLRAYESGQIRRLAVVVRAG